MGSLMIQNDSDYTLIIKLQNENKHQFVPPEKNYIIQNENPISIARYPFKDKYNIVYEFELLYDNIIPHIPNKFDSSISTGLRITNDFQPIRKIEAFSF